MHRNIIYAQMENLLQRSCKVLRLLLRKSSDQIGVYHREADRFRCLERLAYFLRRMAAPDNIQSLLFHRLRVNADSAHVMRFQHL